MKLVIQRVSEASVKVDGSFTGKIDKGFFVLVGATETDTEEIADKLVKKMLGLRIFSDSEGKTNLSLADVRGSLLLVSQFTLYADCRKGNRPSFVKAGSPEHAEKIYNHIVDYVKKWADEQNSQSVEASDSDALIKVETGIFGAAMKCHIENEGPFTIILDSDDF